MHADAFVPAGRTLPPVRLPTSARVEAPGRLHLGFLDPDGTLGRRFGSIGLVLDDLQTVVELSRLGAGSADRSTVFDGGVAELARAGEHLRRLRAATGIDAPLSLALASALPAHAGLGSGTQLALAVGRAFSSVFGLDLPTARLAALLGRGARSGVGIAGFDAGGLLVDGGPQPDGAPASLLARIPLPPAWRVVLVLDPRLQGLHGDGERQAIATLDPLPRAVAAEICHEVLMRVLAGAAGGDFESFAAGVTRIQHLLGTHFAAAQSGRAYASASVERVVTWIARHAHAGIGQSSWGPTGFAFLASLDEARRTLGAARAAGIVDPALDIRVCAARNRGSSIVTSPGTLAAVSTGA
ncbi:MAG TPA: beta-ribofuranosylaminobenzene 5'-phosphate synthase family protein [Burkholderiaceae bacterium]|nr:beta-ribofuranosylaminobenzene 5'-phosphate synthase family protein [Burkholderiaceae bacterium]